MGYPSSWERHGVTQDVRRRAAAFAFGGQCKGALPEERGRAICKLQQPELKAAFAAIYGCHTTSCKNAWMRGKLLQAIGLDAHWKPGAGQPSVQAAQSLPSSSGACKAAVMRAGAAMRRPRAPAAGGAKRRRRGADAAPDAAAGPALLSATVGGAGVPVVHLLLPLLTQPAWPATPSTIEPPLLAFAPPALPGPALEPQLQPEAAPFFPPVPAWDGALPAALDAELAAALWGTPAAAAFAAVRPDAAAVALAAEPAAPPCSLQEYAVQQQQYECRCLQYQGRQPASLPFTEQDVQATARQAMLPPRPPRPPSQCQGRQRRRQAAATQLEQHRADEQELFSHSLTLPGPEDMPSSPFSVAAATDGQVSLAVPADPSCQLA
ncbi:hypothetical protein ABPG75_000331 [Micractinium tetrahymenae]